MIFLAGCSVAYKELTELDDKKPVNFQGYLYKEYKDKAIFEAEEMHDWNTAKLYSEKALKSLQTDNIYPELVSYWKIPKNNIQEIILAHENLMEIYSNAKLNDPSNLAKAIVSLDCWSEQQEENWQTWDIKECKENFLNSMHIIYKNISDNNNKTKNKLFEKNNAAILTENKDNEFVQIIYFDFDQTKLSDVSINNIINFLMEYKNDINEYLIIGHTDTKGSKNYNINLSIERANVVKNILIENKIDQSKIKILGEGENSLAIKTPDDTKHPANRRVEIKRSN